MSGPADLLKAISALSGPTSIGSGDMNKGIENIGNIIARHVEALNKHSEMLAKHVSGADDFRMETLAALRVSTESTNRLAESIEKLLIQAKGSDST